MIFRVRGQQRIRTPVSRVCVCRIYMSECSVESEIKILHLIGFNLSKRHRFRTIVEAYR